MDGFSVDLVEWSLEHRALLRAVHLCERSLYNDGPDLHAAIDCYLYQWLPALNSMTLENWTPPSLDVAWVWHVHKLDPINYGKDCNEWFGNLLDAPHGVNPFMFSACVSSQTGLLNCSAIAADTSEFRSRIVGSAERQSSVLWHLRWPEYDDATFLEESVDRYRSMLVLMGKHPTQFIVPTYDIDNVWHTHMAFPRHYLADCLRIAGREIGHDDSDSDRAAGSKLQVCSAATERLWKDAFGSDWRKRGAMYRGPPPAWFLLDRAAAAAAPAGAAEDFPRASCECAVMVVGCAFGAANEVSGGKAPQDGAPRLGRPKYSLPTRWGMGEMVSFAAAMLATVIGVVTELSC